MKVKVRTLKNVEVEIEIEKTATIAQMKELVQEKMAELAADKQMLIHAGTVLKDLQLVGDYPIKEGDRLIVMQSKKTTPPAEDSKKAPEAAAASAAATTTPIATASATDSTAAAAPNSATATADAAPQQPLTTTVTTTTQSTEQSTVPSANLNTETTTTTTTTETTSEIRAAGDTPSLDGTNVENLVEQIMSIGFPRSDVEVALQAAFLNPERAVEYLTDGIPPELIPGAVPSREAPGDTPLQMPPQPTAGGEAPAGTESALASIRRHPRFNEMRQAIQADPELLPQMLGAITHQNPRLAQQIAENRDEFLQLLGESDEGEGTGGAVGLGDDGAGVAGGAGRGTVQIHLTQAEIEAVQRLEVLGFRRDVVVQAYIVCDKNEEMAANMLFDTYDEDESA